MVYGLCNAAIPLGSGRRLTFWLLALRHRTLANGNRTQRVAAEIATVAADRLEENDWKHISFKESARAGAVGFVPAAAPAVKFFEGEAPRGTSQGSHGLPPGTCSIPN